MAKGQEQDFYSPSVLLGHPGATAIQELETSTTDNRLKDGSMSPAKSIAEEERSMFNFTMLEEPLIKTSTAATSLGLPHPSPLDRRKYINWAKSITPSPKKCLLKTSSRRRRSSRRVSS